MSHILLKYSLALTSLLMLPGCIYEDLSPCYKGLGVSYIIDKDSSGTTEDKFVTDAKSLSVFVFDKDGLYVGVWYLDMKNIGSTGSIPIDLPTGTYSMVMWGGILPNQYSVGAKESSGAIAPLQKGISKLEDFQLKVLETKSGNVVDAKYENLYHSVTSNVPIKEKVNNRINLPVKKLTNDVIVQLQGMPKREIATYSTYNYIDVKIIAGNGMYEYNGSVSNNAPLVTYVPFERVEQIDNEFVEVKMRTLDLFSAKNPQLVIKNSISGTEMYRYNVLKLIQAIKDNSKQSEYVIKIFYNTHGSVQITINDWIVNEIDVKI